MRAIVCSQPDPTLATTRLTTAEVPTPAADEVRVAVHAASLNPVDWKLATGDAPWWEGPHIAGLDGAGVVDAVGSEVHDWQVGDRVVWHADLQRDGVLADYALAPRHVLAAVPEGVGFAEAAALPCAGLTAYQALIRKARIEPGDNVLVQGASGGVGGFGVQIAREFGATVLALTRPEHAERVRALGADHVLDRRDPELPLRVRELTGGYGADAMLEVVNPGDARTSLDLVRYNGHLLCVDPLPDLGEVPSYTYAVSLHEIAVGGAYAAGHRPTQEDFPVMLGHLLDLLAAGRLDPMIERTVGLEEAPAALGALREGTYAGKTVVSVR
ncbi:zinc-binding dehydrogenase [Streptomyces sp. ODS28]|uniref:zinc-binding dehydrogenase n=1 Tax=Streptomyces sp. ODS28 TaxID=3136688 RepID=UPI0031E95D42